VEPATLLAFRQRLPCCRLGTCLPMLLSPSWAAAFLCSVTVASCSVGVGGMTVHDAGLSSSIRPGKLVLRGLRPSQAQSRYEIAASTAVGLEITWNGHRVFALCTLSLPHACGAFDPWGNFGLILLLRWAPADNCASRLPLPPALLDDGLRHGGRGAKGDHRRL